MASRAFNVLARFLFAVNSSLESAVEAGKSQAERELRKANLLPNLLVRAAALSC
jgi:hypothetical protein